MLRSLFILVLFSGISPLIYAQYRIAGKVIDRKTQAPIEYATVVLPDNELWTLTDKNGHFIINNIAQNELRIVVSCLGYEQQSLLWNIRKDTLTAQILMSPSNLALNEVTVTAKNKQDESATSYLIGQQGLEHLHATAIADVMSLLPGGQTNRNLHLATGSPQRITLRGSAGEKDNTSFGTAIEINGVRLSNNAEFGAASSSSIGEIYGIDTRNIATGNIESVEIITGIPSAEYGDVANGIVKINTKKGKSPLSVEVTMQPNTKQVAVSKGFDLSHKIGVLNIDAEYARSISDLASPYTSYKRTSVSALYENTFNKQNKPLSLAIGLTGNVGGYNSQADPDQFLYTYNKQQDNALRGHLRLDGVLNLPWITRWETFLSVNYTDKLSSVNTNKSSSGSIAAIHGTEEGYFMAQNYDEKPDAAIVLLTPGYWYELAHTDNKLIDITAKVKAKWVRQFGKLHSNLMLGADYVRSGNQGRGAYYDDLRYAPTWREYRYDQVPFMNNIALYLEEKAGMTFNESSGVQVMAGLRSDMTIIPQSVYGNVHSWSPRLNVKYFFDAWTVRAGWGRTVKLPSFSVLYPAPSYSDKLAFDPGANSENMIYSAYYIQPYQPIYNPDLKWQSTQQAEIGVETRIAGMHFSVIAEHNLYKNSYTSRTTYTPFEYKLTDRRQLELSPIPSAHQKYTIDRQTGVVTVSDLTGVYPDETLSYRTIRTFKSNSMYVNASPSQRSGVSWIVDFGKIPVIKTSVRLDGKYYRYYGTEDRITASSPTSQVMADGNYYKYVGYYIGSSSTSNGSEKRQVNTNLILTTHIPAIRMIMSLRIESTLYHYTQNLSEYSGGQLGFALDGRENYFPSADHPNRIYNSDRYVAVYPLYYTTYDDMDTKIPFAETFAWAKENDQALYNELARLVEKSNTDYYFNAERLSAYYSANISITKEIGDRASITFNAINFLNNLQSIRYSSRNVESSIYETSYIPKFYYGLSLKIKI